MLFVTFLIFGIFLHTGQSAVSIWIQTIENNTHFGCTGYDGKFYNVGDEWYGSEKEERDKNTKPENCYKFMCEKKDETSVILEQHSCGTVDLSAFKPECIVYEQNLKYPACCLPNIVC